MTGNSLEAAISAIEAQQPKVHNTIWCVGEQLKDIVRREPHWAVSIVDDLKNKDQTLAAVEKKIADLARKHKTGNCGVVSPLEAEEIIREVYGMNNPQAEAGADVQAGDILRLEDFL